MCIILNQFFIHQLHGRMSFDKFGMGLTIHTLWVVGLHRVHIVSEERKQAQ